MEYYGLIYVNEIATLCFKRDLIFEISMNSMKVNFDPQPNKRNQSEIYGFTVENFPYSLKKV